MIDGHDAALVVLCDAEAPVVVASQPAAETAVVILAAVKVISIVAS